MKAKYIIGLTAAAFMLLSGCSDVDPSENRTSSVSAETRTTSGRSETSDEPDSETQSQTETQTSEQELTVEFGDNGEKFIMHLYDNDTAAAIAYYVGTSDWRLPIYHYDDYEGCEYFQYYDIPSRYEIPSAPENITTEKAGEVFYSEPNRIILFFNDAEIIGEYTRVGYFDYSDDFLSAVENNPVIPGWGNKIVVISK